MAKKSGITNVSGRTSNSNEVTIEMIKRSNIEAIKNLNVSVTWDKDFSSSRPRNGEKIIRDNP
ncbi:hypothetical protein MTR_2g033835 [Medicago truncatula]|uniref:Uncharacterized protein n=1 Tax=Medicago truncatula TaxID=3880 RepID=A0A072V694_MEDTR|nr:hypothetical protein MTR_2g033835 [Medicago truncatula]